MGGALLTVAAASLLAVTALLAVWTLQLRGLAALVAGFLVVASAEIVALTIVLCDSYQRGWMLLGHAVLALAAAFAWWRAGKPYPRLRGRIPPWRDALDWARHNPAAAGMAVVACLALALQLVMAIAVAPNNWDSMTYHLGRVAYWLQFDSVLHFDNGTVRQLANPPNAEFLQGWTMLMSGSDRLANTLQWFALIGLAAAIAGLARDLRFGRPAALFAAALFVVLPQPIMQASSTQNDLVVAFFVLAMLMFGLRGARDRSTPDLALFGLALGLAIGTKGTAMLALPPIALVLGVAVWKQSTPIPVIARGVAFAVAGTVLLGSFGYVLNQEDYGSPLGDLPRLTERTSPIGDNAVRSTWTLADSTGAAISWLDRGLRRPINKIFGDVRSTKFAGYSVDAGVHEDTSAFGLLGMVAMLLLVGVLLWWRTPWDRRVLAAAALGYFVLFLAVNEYNMWLGRLMIAGIALGAPLLALMHRWGWTRGLAVALVLLSLPAALFVSPTKPLLVEPGQPTIFGHDRVAQQTLPRGEMRGVLEELAKHVPTDAPIGLARVEDTWDYSFFGEGGQQRRVLPIDGQATAAEVRSVMRAEGLRGVVFANRNPPPGLRTTSLGVGYALALPRR